MNFSFAKALIITPKGKVKILHFTKSSSKQILSCDARLHSFTVKTLSLHDNLLYRTASSRQLTEVLSICLVTSGLENNLWGTRCWNKCKDNV